MGIKSKKNIYQLLEQHLRATETPLTCVQLMDIGEIRKEAIKEYGTDVRTASNKVSDALGLMWRKGLLTRFPAPEESQSFARYSYVWENKTNVAPIKPIAPRDRRSGKQAFEVIEHADCIELSFEKFSVTIRSK